jgi:hypothetical protein
MMRVDDEIILFVTLLSDLPLDAHVFLWCLRSHQIHFQLVALCSCIIKRHLAKKESYEVGKIFGIVKNLTLSVEM